MREQSVSAQHVEARRPAGARLPLWQCALLILAASGLMYWLGFQAINWIAGLL